VAMPDRLRKLQVRLSILEMDGLLVKTAMDPREDQNDHSSDRSRQVGIDVLHSDLCEYCSKGPQETPTAMPR
jgi:hypothetical protein